MTASSRAAGATAVTYSASFVVSGALARNFATITLTADGTRFSTRASDYSVSDSTTGWGGTPAAVTAGGATATLTTPVDARPGDRLVVTARNTANPATAGNHPLGIMTSSDRLAFTQPTSFSAPTQPADLHVSTTSVSVQATALVYTASFLAANGLDAGDSRVVFTGPAGATFDRASCGYVVADTTVGLSRQECLADRTRPANVAVLTVPFSAHRGDRILVLAPVAANPSSSGPATASVSTTADPAPATAPFATFVGPIRVGDVHQERTSPAAAATGVLYTVRFLATDAMTAGASSITLNESARTVLAAPGACGYVLRDTTRGTSACASGSVSGPAVVLTSPLDVSAGDRVEIGVRGVTNPPTTAQSLTIHTSSDPASAVPVPPPAPVGWLHAAGSVIANSPGHPVLLTGFDEGGMYQGEGATPDSCGKTWSAPSPWLGANVAEWGFNSVRLFISWADLEPTAPTVNSDGTITHHWDARYLRALDAVVSDLGSHGVYLIPTMVVGGLSPAFKNYRPGQCEGAGLPTWLFPNAARETYLQGFCELYANTAEPGVPVRPMDGFAAAWQLLAKRYAGNPTVTAMDMINEPAHDMPCIKTSGIAPDYLDALDRRVGTAIRQVSSHVMLVLEGQNHSDGSHAGITTAGLTNVVYTWHTYPKDWATGRLAVDNAIAAARALGCPLWVGEFNVDGGPAISSLQNQNWRSDLSAMTAYLRGAGVSWAYESYDDGWLRGAPTRSASDVVAALAYGVGAPTSG